MSWQQHIIEVSEHHLKESRKKSSNFLPPPQKKNPNKQKTNLQTIAVKVLRLSIKILSCHKIV